jgi:hypothetical protein
MVQVVHRYAERGEFVQHIGYKDTGIYDHVFGRDTFSTRVLAVRCAEKVHPYLGILMTVTGMR